MEAARRRNFDGEKAIKGVRDGLAHLHELGFCHNDVHLANVMLGNDGTAVLINMEFSSEEGRELPQIGKKSNKLLDFAALDRMRAETSTIRARRSRSSLDA